MKGSLGKDLKRIASASKIKQKQFVRKTLIDFFTMVVVSSPVDTGRFRANWMITFGEPSGERGDSKDKSGARKIGQIVSALSSDFSDEKIYFVNNLAYALPIEYGSSKQAPRGVVRMNAKKFKRVASKNIGSYL